MGRPKLPRSRLCVICHRDLLDPTLDSPSQLGRHPRYHFRCHRKVRERRRRDARRSLKAWRGVRVGERVSDHDYKRVNGEGAGRSRRLFKEEGPYHHKQSCACGASYIGGANAVRCPTCQVARHRELKKRWVVLNREKNREYRKKWDERHPGGNARLRRAHLERLKQQNREVMAYLHPARSGRNSGRDESRSPRLPRGGQLYAPRARKAG